MSICTVDPSLPSIIRWENTIVSGLSYSKPTRYVSVLTEICGDGVDDQVEAWNATVSEIHKTVLDVQKKDPKGRWIVIAATVPGPNIVNQGKEASASVGHAGDWQYTVQFKMDGATDSVYTNSFELIHRNDRPTMEQYQMPAGSRLFADCGCYQLKKSTLQFEPRVDTVTIPVFIHASEDFIARYFGGYMFTLVLNKHNAAGAVFRLAASASDDPKKPRMFFEPLGPTSKAKEAAIFDQKKLENMEFSDRCIYTSGIAPVACKHQNAALTSQTSI